MAPITTLQMRRVAFTASRAARTVGFQGEERIIGVWQRREERLDIPTRRAWVVGSG